MAAKDNSDAPLIGVTIVGRYRIISKLGTGGMGTTYRAWDEQVGVPVVIKFPNKGFLEDPHFTERFQREIRLLQGLSYPHIVPILDDGEYDGLLFYVMRFLPGGSLSNRGLKDENGKPRPNPPGMLHLWLPAVAEALDYVHSQGIVHRDVKPANIFFDAFWGAYLGDFGIAKVVRDSEAFDAEHTLTATHMAIGTSLYMAPEQFTPKAVIDGRVDQYALAVTVYEMLAGVRPFTGATAHLIVEVTTHPVPPLWSHRRDLPASLMDTVHRGLAKTSFERFSTCREFAVAVLRGVPRIDDEPGVARLLCPQCSNILKLSTEAAGRRGSCPRCQTKMEVADDLGSLWLLDEAGQQRRRQKRIRSEDGDILPFLDDIQRQRKSPKSAETLQPKQEGEVVIEYAEDEAVEDCLSISNAAPIEKAAHPEAENEGLPWLLLAVAAASLLGAVACGPRSEIMWAMLGKDWAVAIGWLCTLGFMASFVATFTTAVIGFLDLHRTEKQSANGHNREARIRPNQNAAIRSAVQSIYAEPTPAAFPEAEEAPSATANALGVEHLEPQTVEVCESASTNSQIGEVVVPVSGRPNWLLLAFVPLWLAVPSIVFAAMTAYMAIFGPLDSGLSVVGFWSFLTGAVGGPVLAVAFACGNCFWLVNLPALASQRNVGRYKVFWISAYGLLGMLCSLLAFLLMYSPLFLLRKANFQLCLLAILVGIGCVSAALILAYLLFWRWAPQKLARWLGKPTYREPTMLAGTLVVIVAALLAAGATRVPFDGQDVDPNDQIHQASIGQTLSFSVVGSVTGGSVWGSNPYTADSDISCAAVHAGVLRPGESGLIHVTVLPGRQAYEGSGKNDVTSAGYGPYSPAFKIETVEESARNFSALTPQEILAQPPLVNSIGMKLKLIPAGTFQMGSHDGEANEKPVHEVRITRPFYLGIYEVTNAQWKAIMGSVPSQWKDDDRPIEQVTWDQAVEFCKKLSERPDERTARRVYRLPTEAEWEYACRAGMQARYSFGDDGSRLSEFAWYGINSGRKGLNASQIPANDPDRVAAIFRENQCQTHAVGQKKANPWGLHDMHGNVWEWCRDGFENYGDAARTDPVGADTRPGRSTRGGDYECEAKGTTSASRTSHDSLCQHSYVGFRLALTLPESSLPEVGRK